MDRSAPRMVSLRTAVAMVCATTAVFFAGVFAAHAWPGRVGEARSSFTVAGSLTLPAGAARPPMLRFVFHKSGAADCAVDTRAEMPPTGDQFSAQIDFDACGRGFFDGGDVTADVLVNGAAVVTAQPVNPVPYAHFASVAGVARQYETPDCPAGYSRNPSASSATVTVCSRSFSLGASTVIDEVVRVGSGTGAFWVDRFEAVVVNATGVQSDGGRVGYAPLSAGGHWAPGSRDALRSYSAAGYTPSRYITWFQAAAVCHASGKRLLTRNEWFAAADGLDVADPATPVVGTNAGETRCNTLGAAPRQTGLGTACASSWGVQDMIGNVLEWTDEWYAAVGSITQPNVTIEAPTIARVEVLRPVAVEGQRVDGLVVNEGVENWGAGFGADATWNVTSVVYNQSGASAGAPAAALRGGLWRSQTQAGVYALNLKHGPSHQSESVGFRCVIPR